MWDASDADCRMRFIGTNHDIGIRCRGSVRQAIRILRSYLPLVDGIVARQIVIAAIIVVDRKSPHPHFRSGNGDENHCRIGL